jgi:SAM-dependent methyltransferase
MDAERMDLEDDAVDGVLCQSGYMLMADVEQALAETRRVLRPRGRLALSVWGAPERNPWASIGARILVERGHMPPPEPGRPGVFSMAAPERVRAPLEGAGFENVRTDEVGVEFLFRDIEDYVQWAIDMAGPLAMVLRGLSSEELRSVAAEVEEAFAPFSAHGGYTLQGAAVCAIAQ